MTDDPHRQPQKPGYKPPDTTAKAARPDMPGTDGTTILAQDFDAGSLYGLRAAVAAHASAAGAPERRAGDIVLAVHELAVNAIRHGAGHGRLLISEHDGTLHCQVSDDAKRPAAGLGTGPDTQADSRGGPPWPSEEGHGLWLVRQVADQLSVETGSRGTVATASFTLPLPGQQRPAPR